MKGGLICCIVCAICAMVLAAVALVIDYWYYYAVLGVENYFGLWKTCLKHKNVGAVCTEWKDIPKFKADWLHACQGMMVLSVILSFIGIAVVLLHIFILRHTKQLVKLAAILFFVAGFCGCIAFVVFAAKYKDLVLVKESGHLHAGFAMAVVSALIGIIAGIAACCTKPSPYESY